MTRRVFGFVAFVALLGLITPAAAEDKKDDSGWIQLFNGKDLTGWKSHPKNPGKWKVEDGILIGSGPVSHLFSESGDYDNFHYRIEAMINDKGNSGQYFRTAFGPGFPKGYEAQINSTHRDPQKTGGIYNLAKVMDQLVKPGEWFTQEVIADGNHLVVLVNGKKVTDFTDKKNTYKKGHFAIQQHDPGSVIKIKKIEYKPIKK